MRCRAQQRLANQSAAREGIRMSFFFKTLSSEASGAQPLARPPYAQREIARKCPAPNSQVAEARLRILSPLDRRGTLLVSKNPDRRQERSVRKIGEAPQTISILGRKHEHDEQEIEHVVEP